MQNKVFIVGDQVINPDGSTEEHIIADEFENEQDQSAFYNGIVEGRLKRAVTNEDPVRFGGRPHRTFMSIREV